MLIVQLKVKWGKNVCETKSQLLVFNYIMIVTPISRKIVRHICVRGYYFFHLRFKNEKILFFI